jgi:pimeloyl-ACP methyl ester carboxylesterase
MRPLELDTRQVRASDGTELTYQVTAGRGPWVVLINGLGAGVRLWHHLIDYLGADYRFLSWDYRELYDRSAPGSRAPAGQVGIHARDMGSVLEAEHIDSSVWISWSVGSQVLLEALGDRGERATHLVMVNPTFGAMQAGPLPPVRSTVAPRAIKLIERSHRLAAAIARRVARQPETVSWIKRLGLVGPTIDEEAFAEVAATFADINMQAFFRNLRAFEEQDATPLLDRVKVPALLIGGERDLLAPKEKIEAASRRMSGSEVFTIRGCTHYAPLEFPELINLRVEKFLRERGAWQQPAKGATA